MNNSHTNYPHEIDKIISPTNLTITPKVFVVSLFATQIAFHAICMLISLYMTDMLAKLNIAVLTTNGLDLFAADMWITVIVAGTVLFGLMKVIKLKTFPFITLAFYPAILLLMSLAREASFLLVLLSILAASSIIASVIFKQQSVKD